MDGNNTIMSTIFAEIENDLELHRCNPFNPSFNCTKEEYLLYNRGPQTLSWAFVLPVR